MVQRQALPVPGPLTCPTSRWHKVWARLLGPSLWLGREAGLHSRGTVLTWCGGASRCRALCQLPPPGKNRVELKENRLLSVTLVSPVTQSQKVGGGFQKKLWKEAGVGF